MAQRLTFDWEAIQDAPLDLCFHSPFNPRKSRDAQQVERIAERIRRSGFDRTRAVWARPVDGRYEVFAGGTRLEAARAVGLITIPLLNRPCSDDEAASLTEYDNENDESHQPLSPVDHWAEYARLKSKGWKQQRIAKAKGVDRSIVARRLQFHAMPHKVKNFVRRDLLAEFHLAEIVTLCAAHTLSPWLTTSQAWEELAEKAVHDRGKNGSKSREAVKKDVEVWRGFIACAEEVLAGLPEEETLYGRSSDPPAPYTYRPRKEFVALLAEGKVRSLPKVKVVEKQVRDFMAGELASYSRYVELKSLEAVKAAETLQRETELRERFLLGDARDLVQTITGPIHLVLTDPPWGHNYQSNRRWASAPSPRMAGDTPEEAIKLLEEVLTAVAPKLAEDAHVLVFTGWQQEHQVRAVLEGLGLQVKGSLIWVKEEHTAGDVAGSFAPSHERIVHAVKGAPVVSPRIRDVIEETRTRETSHPAGKPVGLLSKLIKSTTEEGDLVVDPLAGCAGTLVAAWEARREFWGCELDETYWEEGQQRLLKLVSPNA